MSRDQLIDVVRQLIDLLDCCDQVDEATWLKEHLNRALTTDGFDWAEFRSDLHRRTMGMGSLSDIVLRPREGSGVNKEEANNKLAELTNVLYRLTK
jgi:hypothetical protein